MKRGTLIMMLFLFVCALVSQLTACAADESTSSSKVSNPNYWDKKKGDCDAVLTMPHAYTLAQITQCTKLWEMYRYVDDIQLKERSMYAVAFSQVSHTARDAYDRAIADAALARICIPRHPIDSEGNIRESIPDSLDCRSIPGGVPGGVSMASSNPFLRIKSTVPVEEPTPSESKTASAAYKKAIKTRKTSASRAIPQYREVLDSYPFHVGAKYDLACALAVTGDERGALKELEELYSWDDAEAELKLEKARTDEDFESIRDNPNFKLLTGYVSIAIINGAGAVGEPTIAAMKKKLESKNYAIATMGKSSRPELVPVIWYREGFEDYANKIKDVLGQRKTAVKLLTKPTANNNDVVVVWGQPEASNLGVAQSAPVVQGKRATGSDSKINDLLDGVDEATSTVDRANSAADKVTSLPGSF